jgi:ferredoxin
MEQITVDAARCLRCGACSSIIPAVFQLGDAGVVIVRQPADDRERALARAALVNCPSSAIGVR